MTSFSKFIPVAIFSFYALKLSLIDARQHILPNRLVLTSAVAICASEVTISALSGSWNAFTKSSIVALETLLVYLLLILLSRGQLGLGDLKYSFVTGLTIGWLAPNLWLWCIWCAFALASLWIVLSKIWTTRSPKSAIAFGPFMSLAVALCSLSSQINF